MQAAAIGEFQVRRMPRINVAIVSTVVPKLDSVGVTGSFSRGKLDRFLFVIFVGGSRGGRGGNSSASFRRYPGVFDLFDLIFGVV